MLGEDLLEETINVPVAKVVIGDRVVDVTVIRAGLQDPAGVTVPGLVMVILPDGPDGQANRPIMAMHVHAAEALVAALQTALAFERRRKRSSSDTGPGEVP